MKKSGILIRVAGWLLGLLGLALGAVAMFAVLVDPNDYKPEITALVAENTDRTLELHGDLEVTFFPWLGVKTGAVELSNRQGFGPAPMLAVEEATIRIKLLPLLITRVEVAGVSLIGPQIRLARKADGTANWDDLTAKAGHDDDQAPPDAALLAGLAVQGIVIQDGWVEWDDQFAGQTVSLSALNLETGKLAPGKITPIDLSLKAEGNLLPEPAVITLTGTAQLGKNLASVSLNNTDLGVVMESISADFSTEKMDYGLHSERATLTNLRGVIKRGEVRTRLSIPALNFNLSDESLQLPRLEITQDDATLSASLNGAGVLSDLPQMTAKGGVEARAGNLRALLKRNHLKAHRLPGLAVPMGVNFRFDLANSNLTLIDLGVKSPPGEDGKWLVKPRQVIIPLNPDGSFDAAAFSFLLGDLLKARVKTELNDLKGVLKKGVNKNWLKSLGVGN